MGSMSCRILRKSLFFYGATTNLFEIFCGFERVHGIFADCSSSGSCGLPVVWQPPVALHGAAQHLGPEKTWPPGVSPVSRQQIMEWRRRKKYGEIERKSQMLHCRLMLIIRVQGQEKKTTMLTAPDVWRKRHPWVFAGRQRGITHPLMNAADSACIMFGPKGHCGCLTNDHFPSIYCIAK